jgi:hypothetical protein
MNRRYLALCAPEKGEPDKKSGRQTREIIWRQTMDPKKTALVLIEFQNDFTTERGTLHGAVKGVMEKNNMLANTIETVKKARAAGATIVWVPITFAEGYGEMRPEPYGILKGVKDSKSFVKGGWGAQIVDSLKPEASDIIVEGKRGHRKWGSEADVETLFKTFRLRQDEMYDLSLISPTKAEKMFKQNPKRWAKVTDLITQSEGKPSVAPATDKRPAMVVQSVAEEFSDLIKTAN